jgi:methionyl-tRNA formyltransferase
MRIAYFANNWLGWKVAEWLSSAGEEFACAVVHPPERRRHGQEILEAVARPDLPVLDGSRLRQADVLAALRETRADLGLSINFGYRIPPDVLSLFPFGALNVHTGLLPYNRGAHPNVWSIVERTPAGVTIHFMDAGLDTGDVVSQRRVEIEPIDTGETLHAKLQAAALDLLIATWPSIRGGTIPRQKQDPAAGTSHRVAELHELDEIDLDAEYRARDLIDRLRARTFPPFAACHFVHDGRRVQIELRLSYETSSDGDEDDPAS